MNSKTRVLIVEDETPLAMLMVSVLTRFNCDVDATYNGRKAMELATQKRFDLITLDIGLPGMNGFDLYGRLRKIPGLEETPIVFVSGSCCIENQQRALDLGAADFIEKPFDAQDFLSRILSLVEETATV